MIHCCAQVAEVGKDPATQGRLLVDIMNEPDNFSLRCALSAGCFARISDSWWRVVHHGGRLCCSCYGKSHCAATQPVTCQAGAGNTPHWQLSLSFSTVKALAQSSGGMRAMPAWCRTCQSLTV
jgi:hypothetical protein